MRKGELTNTGLIRIVPVSSTLKQDFETVLNAEDMGPDE